METAALFSPSIIEFAEAITDENQARLVLLDNIRTHLLEKLHEAPLEGLEFVESRKHLLIIELKFFESITFLYHHLTTDGTLPLATYRTIRDRHLLPCKLRRQRELLVLAAHKRSLAADIDDALRGQDVSAAALLRAYREAIRPRIAAVRIAASHPQTAVQRELFRCRLAARYLSMGLNHTTGARCYWCPITAAWQSDWPEPTHIVPRALQGRALAYLFGDREVNLDDPRNGLTLEPIWKNHLEQGQIAIVPYLDVGFNALKYKAVWTTLGETPISLLLGLNSNAPMDLTFCSDFRPGNRFLCFRFLLTAMQQVREGRSLDWMEQVQGVGGVVWPLPEPYFRAGMLRKLSRALHAKLPHMVTEQITLPESFEPQTTADRDEEDLMVHELEVMIRQMDMPLIGNDGGDVFQEEQAWNGSLLMDLVQ